MAGHDLVVCSVLSGNRNFEGRIHPECRTNFLASPPLVVAYALAGSLHADLLGEPLGNGRDGQPVYLRDVWPAETEIAEAIGACLRADMFAKDYADIFTGDEHWQGLAVPGTETFQWDERSTYVRRPPYFDDLGLDPEPVTDITGARVLAKLGGSVTTDHISPAGAIGAGSPAGRYLIEHGIDRQGSTLTAPGGATRGDGPGTFANIRLRNQLAPGTEGGFTRDFSQPGGPVTTVYEASVNYVAAGVPLVVLAGKEYGSGSSRDWAAKGTRLLGVRAVLAESFERIHRSNLVGMGVLPLQFQEGDSAERLGLSGEETYAITGLGPPIAVWYHLK